MNHQRSSNEQAVPKFEPQDDPDGAGKLGIHNDELGGITFDGKDGHYGITYKNLPIPIMQNNAIHIVHSANQVNCFMHNSLWHAQLRLFRFRTWCTKRPRVDSIGAISKTQESGHTQPVLGRIISFTFSTTGEMYARKAARKFLMEQWPFRGCCRVIASSCEAVPFRIVFLSRITYRSLDGRRRLHEARRSKCMW